MPVVYDQDREERRRTLPPDTKIYLWNSRGGFVEAIEADRQKLLSKGFKEPTELENKRFQPGDYHPAYDSSITIQSVSAPEINDVRNANPFLEGIWV